jgi:DNA-binding response OmpR family regulator
VKILLVEDDRATYTLLEQALAAHYQIEVATDGRSALALAEQETYDLLILDLGIPQVDGLQVCQQLRSQNDQTLILLLTAQDQASDRILGLDAGADDYVVKPFHLPELLARIRALLRRGRFTAAATHLTWGAIEYNGLTHEIRYGGQRLRLTPKEHRILELLLSNPQRIFSRSTMIDQLWELGDPPTESAISSHIKAIRQKLKAAGAQQDLIETIYGFGYRLRSIESALPHAGVAEPTAGSDPGTVTSNALPETQDTTEAATLMAELWERFRDSFQAEIASLEAIVQQFQTGALPAHLRQEAQRTVHKLVGSLGVYGFSQGSKLAKQIADLLHADIWLTDTEMAQIATLIKALKQQLSQPPPSVQSYSAPIQPRPRVLLVSHDPELTASISLPTLSRSLQITIVPHPTDSNLDFDQGLPEVILLDLTDLATQTACLAWLEMLAHNYSQIPVLVLIEPNSLSIRLAATRLGARQFLTKPISTTQILQSIDRVLSPRSQADSRVLIVDDDSAMLEFLSHLLTPWGLEVVTLDEPQRFWQVLVAVSPDLILLDLEMPQISGLELCEVVRRDAQWGDLPLLVVTAHTDADSLQQAFAAGADDFITKPILGPELVTRVLSRIARTQLRGRHRTLTIGESDQ